FLPVRDGKGRPTAWDVLKKGFKSDEIEICQCLREAVDALRELAKEQGETRWFDYELITSYPHLPLDGYETNAEPLPWQSRSIEVLFQRRPKLKSPLLTYGPERSSHVASGAEISKARRYDRAEGSHWKARIWRECIERLAEALRKPDEATPIVLLT